MRNSQLAVFDLDRTLIKSNCSFDFCRYLVKQQVLPRVALLYACIYYVRHTFLKLSLERLHTQLFKRFLLGLSLELLEKHAARFVDDYLAKQIYLPAHSQLQLAHHLGHYTLIVSNSPSFLVERFARAMGVSGWRATEYAIDKERKLCHIASLMKGEEKAVCALKMAEDLKLAPSQITAYSDSMWDLPLLRAAGNPVAVNPDAKLRKWSRAHQWKIL